MSEHQATQARWGADYVQAISPYVGGKPIAEVARQFGLEPGRIVKLASNENPLGMSPRAKEAMLSAMEDSTRYPDNDGYALKQALAARLGVPAGWITLGHGSSDLLEMAARALLTDADAGMYARYSFIVYTQAVQGVGAAHQIVPDRDFGHDLPAMLAAITPQTKLIFVANPNNPTGTFLPAGELHDFLRKVPPHIAVVLDEAYVEYTLPALRYDSMAWVREFPNLMVSRTFSKAYGLAGLRPMCSIACVRPSTPAPWGRLRPWPRSTISTSSIRPMPSTVLDRPNWQRPSTRWVCATSRHKATSSWSRSAMTRVRAPA